MKKKTIFDKNAGTHLGFSKSSKEGLVLWKSIVIEERWKRCVTRGSPRRWETQMRVLILLDTDSARSYLGDGLRCLYREKLLQLLTAPRYITQLAERNLIRWRRPIIINMLAKSVHDSTVLSTEPNESDCDWNGCYGVPVVSTQKWIRCILTTLLSCPTISGVPK